MHQTTTKKLLIFSKKLTTVLIENLDAEENIIVGGYCPIQLLIRGGLLTPQKSVVDIIEFFQDHSFESCESCEFQKLQVTKRQAIDGIPVEFYNRLWSLIGEPFIKCVNECTF